MAHLLKENVRRTGPPLPLPGRVTATLSSAEERERAKRGLHTEEEEEEEKHSTALRNICSSSVSDSALCAAIRRSESSTGRTRQYTRMLPLRSSTCVCRKREREREGV